MNLWLQIQVGDTPGWPDGKAFEYLVLLLDDSFWDRRANHPMIQDIREFITTNTQHLPGHTSQAAD